MQFPRGWQAATWPSCSVSRRLRSLPFWPLAASEPSRPLPFVPSSSSFPFPLRPFPSPEIYFSVLSSLCPLLFLPSPSERMDAEQQQPHSSQPVRPAPSGLQRVTGRGEACLTPVTPRPSAAWLETYSVIEVQTSYHVMLGSVTVPIFLPSFSCHQEKSHWEQAQVADFYTVVYTRVRIPSMGCPTDNVQLTGFRAWSPRWAVDRVLPPSLALSERAQVSVWIDVAISFSFSGISVPPPSTSSFVLTPALPTLLSWKVLGCVQVLWLISLCCSLVCSTALASLYRHCGYGGAFKPWNTNIAHIAWNSSLGLLSGILKNKKKRQELASLSPLSLQYNYSAWVLRNYLISSVPPQTEGIKKGHFKLKWENYEISGSIEINLSNLNLWVWLIQTCLSLVINSKYDTFIHLWFLEVSVHYFCYKNLSTWKIAWYD